MRPNIWNKLDNALCGSVFALCRANRVLQQQLQDCRIESFELDARQQHCEQRLQDCLLDSIARVQSVEQKAMNALLGESVAIAVFAAVPGVLGPGGLLRGGGAGVRVLAALALVAGILYLFGSVLLALQAYRVGGLYRPELADWEPLANAQHRAQVQLYCIEQNWRVATLRANRLSASFNCLRNGLLVVILIGIMIVLMGMK